MGEVGERVKARKAPFSKGARRGAPPVYLVRVKEKLGLCFPVNVAHPPKA